MCDIQQHFSFFVSESCDWGVLYTHNTRLLILVVLIFYFCNRFLFTNFVKKYQLQPSNTSPPSQSCEEDSQKNQPPLLQRQWMQLAIAAANSLTTSHSGCYSCINGWSPQEQCWLVLLSQVVEKQLSSWLH